MKNLISKYEQYFVSSLMNERTESVTLLIFLIWGCVGKLAVVSPLFLSLLAFNLITDRKHFHKLCTQLQYYKYYIQRVLDLDEPPLQETLYEFIRLYWDCIVAIFVWKFM